MIFQVKPATFKPFQPLGEVTLRQQQQDDSRGKRVGRVGGRLIIKNSILEGS